jgi:hypothetical protein
MTQPLVRMLGVLATIIAVTGCSARLNGGQVAKINDQPKGIRYNTTVPHEVRIFFWDGEQTKVQGVAVLPLPTVDLLREINYQGAFARSYKFELNLRPDGTLADVSLTPQGGSQLSDSGAAIEEAIKTVRERLDERDPDVRRKKQLERENDLLEATKKNRELKEELGE